MAHIVDCDYLVRGMPDGEPLPLERKALVLDLAKRGHEQSMRAWRAFERDDPLSAAAVVKYADGTLSKGAAPKVPPSAPELSQRALLAAWANDSDYDLARGARGALAALEAS